jgi:hypothetical protein
MSKGGRDSLKQLFKAGKLPSEKDFGSLIESMLHMDDEGFRKHETWGLQVTSDVASPGLVTFYRRESRETPLWRITHASLGHQLRLSSAEVDPDARRPPALLTLDDKQFVGIAQESPEHTLHVGGVVASRARVGTLPRPSLAEDLVADHKWKVLVGGLTGCSVLEVVVAIDTPGGGRSAVLHAVATNAGHPQKELPWWLGWMDRWVNRRNRIRAVDAWFGEKCDRLELRWQADKEAGKYALAVRSACDYRAQVEIKAHVTELWPAKAAKPTPKETTPEILL